MPEVQNRSYVDEDVGVAYLRIAEAHVEVHSEVISELMSTVTNLPGHHMMKMSHQSYISPVRVNSYAVLYLQVTQELPKTEW